MHRLRFLQLDVFPARFGGGNPLGVVIDGSALDAATMQAIAAWTNLVETTFLLPPDDPQASYRVRIFTPTREIPFAGHPSVGSAHAALESGLCAPQDGLLWQQCGAGTLPIRVEDQGTQRRLFVQAPAASLLETGATAATSITPLLEGHALAPLGAALVDGGRRWWLAELADAATLRQWRPEHAAIAQLAAASDSMGLCLFARENVGLAVRAFPAGAGIAEDPASGAANGLIAAFIAQRDGKDSALARGYEVSQGREMGHDAHLSVRIDADAAIWVGGRCNSVIDGHLQWP
ncbi:PhzF family phenazine biosynthesis protein [Denitratimonas sp. CY0512]|uniref:PhzF family phenazine biosynthesis protein n=1 Tax=Denitratimonas sp. CY0512 TaxID=3131940 RepID=UPI0030A9B0DD